VSATVLVGDENVPELAVDRAPHGLGLAPAPDELERALAGEGIKGEVAEPARTV
jgi:hypothetical protein